MKIKNTPEGLVIYKPETYQTIRLTKPESGCLGVRVFPKDTPPEIVHLEISDRCNLSCPYCYVKNQHGKELPLPIWQRIIKDLAESGVFQVTFGGGEPTMREDLDTLARYTKELGLTLCMTSNGLKIPEISKKTLKLFDQINISWHRQVGFDKALSHLKKIGVRRGINFCLSKDYVKDIDYITRVSKEYEAEILLLTYKPVNNDWKNQVLPEEVYKLALEMNEEKIAVAIDGLTCNTCLASKRFCDVNSKGDVSICSFIREPIGSLLTTKFLDIWHNRPRQVACPYKKGGENL